MIEKEKKKGKRGIKTKQIRRKNKGKKNREKDGNYDSETESAAGT